MLQEIVSEYLEVFPEERARLGLLQEQLAAHEPLNDRKNFRGHIAGAGIVVSPDRNKILAVHHRFFDDWFQPGGHWEAEDPDPWTAARREAIEETGVSIARLLAVINGNECVPLDIATYHYDARPEKNEPAHFHHDFRYAFLAADENLKPQESEVVTCTWLTFDDPRLKNMQRVVAKLRRFKVIA